MDCDPWRPAGVADEELLARANDIAMTRRRVDDARSYRASAVGAVALVILSSLLQRAAREGHQHGPEPGGAEAMR